jgi:hypothetical protein
MLVGVVAVTALAVVINRIVGIPHPLWRDPGAKRETGRD